VCGVTRRAGGVPGECGGSAHAPRRSYATIIRELIRKQAPGTLYVDVHNRENYVRHVALSDMMDNFLKTFDARIKTAAVPKLKKVMESEHWIEVGS
jgi:hypothetical protein